MTKDQASKLRDLIPGKETFPRVENSLATQRIGITSGKGGVGKSIIALNLSILLAKSHRPTLLIDGDLNLSNISILTDTAPEFGFLDVKQGNKLLKDVIFPYQDNLSILTSGSGELKLLNSKDEFLNHLRIQFQQLDGKFDYVCIDSPSGISSLVFGELASCDEVFVVSTPDPTSITDAYAIVKMMTYFYPHIPLYLILNFVRSEDDAFEAYKKFDLITEKFLHRQINYLGCLNYSDEVIQSVLQQQPLALREGSSIFIDQLKKIMNRWLESAHSGYESIMEFSTS
ncbi:AAA family ATPase [candidate division KSB1 bacterium]|nr:AAA family ATPase [candidate division KSB1 bacterium]